MTVEKRTTIAPTDILAAELECTKCKHRIIRPSGIWRPIIACPNCGVSWHSHSELLSTLETALFKLSGITAKMLEDTQAPFRTRLEITGEKEEP